MSLETMVILAGLALNALATFGALMRFGLRIENRMTRIETVLELKNLVGGSNGARPS